MLNRIRLIGLGFTLVYALSALTAASALAWPTEWDAAVYNPTAEVQRHAANTQAFSGAGVVIACPTATFNTDEAIGKLGAGKEATNPKANAATLHTHPTYGNPNVLSEECRGTLPATSVKVEAKANLCNY